MTYAEHRRRAEEIAQIEPYPGKVCGGCTACCSVVPVKEIGTQAYQRCPHVLTPPSSTVGCSIYPHRPRSCRAWACGWLATDWPDDLRPDRCGVIVDPAEDVIWLGDKPDAPVEECKETLAARLWVMPGFEEAWRHDPAQTLILSFVDAGFAVLWDLPPDLAGVRKSRVFHKSATGFAVTEPRANLDKVPLDQTERYWRAQQLAERS